MLSNTRVLAPTVVNEMRFGYNRLFNQQVQWNAFENNVIGDIGGIPGVAVPEPILYGIPAIGITGYAGFGDPALAPNVTKNHVFQVTDNMSIIRGKHSLRFGLEIRRDRFNHTGNQFPRGNFSFAGNTTQDPQNSRNTGDGFADYMLGMQRSSAGSLGIAVAQLRATRQYYYIDDSWKIRPNLTINLGLRYEYSPPYVHKHDNMINTEILHPFDQSQRPTVVRAGEGDFYEDMPFRYAPEVRIARDDRLGRALVRTDSNDFAPRFGLAYSPTPKWTFRTGGGVFFTQDIGNARFDMSRNLAARRDETSNNDFPSLTLDAPFTNHGALVVPFPLILSNNVNRRTPYVLQYLFNIQRQLTSDSMVELGYTGNLGHKLERFRPYNMPIPGPGNVQTRRPYPELGIIQKTDGVVNSNYHSFAARFQKQFSNGVTALISYTFSKAIDNGSAIRTHGGDEDFPEDTYNLRHSRGLSNYHQTQRLATSVLWEPPLGAGKAHFNNGVGRAVLGDWQIGSIITYRTGLPYTMRNNIDDANIGWNSQHPNRTSAPLEPANGRDPEEYFNRAAFERIAPYTYGNVGRNTMIGPEQFSWDFSAMKRFPMPVEGHELQFRFEAFNFPNRPNFSTPNSSINSTSYAKISSTDTTMRELQFSLKYVF